MVTAVIPMAGVDFNRRSQDKEFTTGTVQLGDNNRAYIYVQAGEDLAANATCSHTNFIAAAAEGGAYTNPAAFVEGEYGWIRRTNAIS